ncbi:MAG TPA: aldolase/citrate lyase family protein [Bryobacteraceae bacterium]|nr:aldolase/citrate lyase family protein [Bryobacteraceae bacterium]
MLASTLKERLRSRQLTMGPLLSFDFWPGYLEIFKAEGMHYAVLDLEHGSATLAQVEDLCRVARLLDFPLIVRPEASVYHLLRKYLDMGAAGFMLPWVESEEQLSTARDALFTPPRGRRGPGGPAVFHNRTLDRQGWDEIERDLFLMPQIETSAGLEKVAQIAATPWVDATMLGPYDLSLNLGHCGEMDHPEVVDAIQAVHDASAGVGKPCGMVIATAEQARFWMARGFFFFITGEVSYLARQQARSLVRQMQEFQAGGK